MSPGIRSLNVLLHDGLAQAFPHVHVIPGEVNLWLASPGLDLAGMPASVLERRWTERNIPAHLVSADHIRYKLRPDRLRWFWETLEIGDPVQQPVKRNEDLHPSGLLYGLLYWSELFSPRLSGYLTGLTRLGLVHFLGPVLALTVLVAIIRTRRSPRVTVPFAIGTSGFVGMTLDLVLIFAFQSLYGHVYQQIGLLITAFMIGLSLGAWWMSRWLRTKAIGSEQPVATRSSLVKLEAAIVVYLSICPLALAFLHTRALEPAGFTWVRPALLALNGVAGLLVGLEFPLANALYVARTSGKGETAGILYAADLGGACLGALAVSAALLPALGILGTCALLVVLKLGSLVLVATMSSRNHVPTA